MRSIDHLTGGEIAQIAYDQPPIKPFGVGFASEVLTYILTILCAIVVGLRVYVRTFKETTKQKWRINDYLAVFGFLPLIPAGVFAVLSGRYGIGQPDSHFKKFENHEFLRVRGLEYLIWYELTYYAASTITKFAIAFTILHICMDRKYAYLMYSIMVIMALSMAGCLIALFVNCQPFPAYWNPKIGHCKDVQGFLILSYCGTAAQVAMDWSCAITPFFIVRTLQMPRRTKISVIAILGLGILASIAALMRIISYKYIDEIRYPNDHMLAQGRLILWSVFESSFAIIACSLPPLKKLFSSCLGRSTNRSNLTPGSRALYNSGTALNSLTPNGQSHATVSTKGRWDRLHDDDSSARHIIKSTEVHIDTESMTSRPP